MGPMSEPDAHGIIRGCCGDTMEIYLRLDGDRIEAATFMTDSRESAVACGSMLTRMATGMSLGEAGMITQEYLVAALDGLPEAKVHCANLALNTLRGAMANWRAADKTWQAYRRGVASLVRQPPEQASVHRFRTQSDQPAIYASSGKGERSSIRT